MSLHAIKIPDIGEGIAEVELVAWHVKPGDTVAVDQPLADVMTEKATIDIPSPVSGIVVSLGGTEGQILAVGSELIRIEMSTDTAAEHANPQPGPVSQIPSHPLASPVVRHRAKSIELDLNDVVGTGTGGRIMQADIDAAVAHRPSSTPPQTAPAAHPPTSGTATTPYIERNDEQTLPVIGVRRKIAEKMQESKRHIPHFSYVEEVDVTEVEHLRNELNSKWEKQRVKLTLLPFIVRAVVRAVELFPQINARFDDQAGVVTRHGAVHVGIATQTESGLMVPVLRHAEALDLWSIATEIRRLAEVTRSGKATREELTASTVTVTSLGALGGIVTTPIIHHPEVAIVGVNRIVERPVIRDGAIVARLMMNLSSSFDHRVVDGIDAAQFVQALRGLLEMPALLFID